MPEKCRISEFFHRKGVSWQRKVVIVTRSRNSDRPKILLLCKGSITGVPVMVHFSRIFHETVFSRNRIHTIGSMQCCMGIEVRRSLSGFRRLFRSVYLRNPDTLTDSHNVRVF